ncbi:phage holin family protein [Facklamia hominis]
MRACIKYFEVIAMSLGAVLGWYLGSPDGFLYALVAFVVADYVTGVLRAGVERKLSSTIGFRGIARKIMIFILVGVAHLIDTFVVPDANDVIRTAVIFFYIANEGLSIIENSAALGLPIPTKLTTSLKQLHREEINEQDEEGI